MIALQRQMGIDSDISDEITSNDDNDELLSVYAVQRQRSSLKVFSGCSPTAHWQLILRFYAVICYTSWQTMIIFLSIKSKYEW